MRYVPVFILSLFLFSCKKDKPIPTSTPDYRTKYAGIYISKGKLFWDYYVPKNDSEWERHYIERDTALVIEVILIGEDDIMIKNLPENYTNERIEIPLVLQTDATFTGTNNSKFIMQEGYFKEDSIFVKETTGKTNSNYGFKLSGKK